MKKSGAFSQIFLHSRAYRNKMIGVLADEIDSDTACEIGTGKGALTVSLLSLVRHLYCVEIDAELIAYLKRALCAHKNNVTFIQADIRKFPLARIGRRIPLISNVPYQISSDFIRYLIDNRRWITKGFFLLQKEFAGKLTARPGKPGYGFLTCALRLYADTRLRFPVPAGAFRPRPKVDSLFLTVEFLRRPRWPVKNQKEFLSLLQTAFRTRRKQIQSIFPEVKRIPDFESRTGISPDARPATISLEKYVRLARILKKEERLR
ncbi:MAG: ribosomal RNA small subunit methyltransferase A [Candidatus Omnitrophica bacterium]|nr:ribosomal RNA small subunit methyltransferase A [Candidatus Omnitrophota bacterium]